MANEEHLRILEQGVEAWNAWRNKNETMKPDLKDVYLIKETLDSAAHILEHYNFSGANRHILIPMGANLRGANFSGADLSRSYLCGADLCEADLNGANLSRAELCEAMFSQANLSGADLNGANLSQADLRRTNLSGADLSGAYLSKANLSYAYLSGANIREATLQEASLSGADLSYAFLVEADLSRADLSGADLSRADLRGSNIQKASLHMARVINANLDRANLTEACLWETQRAGWSIKGVICESIYWDKEAKVKTIYAPGEFEKLFADKTRIRLFYKDGISALEIVTLPALIQHLEESHPGSRLRFVSIKEDSGGAVVELAIEGDEDYSPEQVKQLQAALEKEAQQRVEYQRLALSERDARLELQGGIEQLNAIIDKLILRPTLFIGGDMGDKYEISGQAGAVGPHAHAHDMTFNQIVSNIEQTIDFSALAKELSELRQAMAAKQDSSPQAVISAGEVAKAEIAATEKNALKVVEHLKAAGQWTLDFARAVGKDVVVAAIKKAMGME